MKPPALSVLVAALILTCAACEPPPPAIDSHSERIARLESDVQQALVIAGEDLPSQSVTERMALHSVPGLSIAFFDDGEIAWTRAYGMADVEAGVAATPETLFQAASISKAVAAMAALALVEEGVLELDADINATLRTWRVPEHAWSATSPVTLRGLITHSAGLTVHGFPGYGPDTAVPTTAGVLAGEGNTPAVFVNVEPRTMWRYSGGGYTVMQRLVSDVLAEPFPQIMRARVLEPLGMAQSTYEQPLPAALRPQAATGYRGSGEPVEGSFHTYPEMAAAGLWTTPSDLARFAIALQRARAGAAHPVVSNGMVDQILTADEFGHGLGPALPVGGTYFGHGGANEGFRCLLRAQMDGGQGVAIMTNSDGGGALAQELLLTVAREYGWSGHEPTVKTVIPLDEARLPDYAGRYRAEGAPGDVVVRVADGRLVVAPEWDTAPLTLYPESATEFFAREGGLTVVFELAAGQARGFRAQGLDFRRLE